MTTFVDHPALVGRRVLVVGAGVIGAAVARSLAAAGAEVTVLDRSATAGGTSASGEGNVLVSDKGPGPELELAQRSLSLWPGLVTELAEELGPGFPAVELEAKGGLVVATSEAGAGALLGFATEQRAAGVRAEVLDDQAARALEPDLAPGLGMAVHYPEDAQVQPVAATEALLASARRHGARVLQGREVLEGLVQDGRLVGVRTGHPDTAELHCDHVVLAAGPWSGEVADRLGVRLPVAPRRGTVLVTSRMAQRIRHKVYDADYVGAVSSGAADLQVSSVVESTAAGTVLIGSSRERRGFDPRVEPGVLAEIARRALLLFPFLTDASVMRAYGGFRPFVPDHLPVIGADPRLPGLWHATGHEGAGIGLAPATAELITDLMSGATPQLAADPFAVGRPGLREHLEPAA